MTYDEIMALSGRELDAAVAEHVYRREVQWLTLGSLRCPRFRTDDGWELVPSFSCDSAMALPVMAWVISRGSRARNLFYPTLWAQAGWPAASESRLWAEAALTTLILEDKLPEAICRAAVYVAMQPQWMGSNDSNQCESSDGKCE
jgi:hypothetical protein